MEGQTYKKEAALLRADTASLGTRIRALQAANASLDKQNESYKRDSLTTEEVIKSLRSMYDASTILINKWETAYKKEKRKRIWTSISGAVLTAAAIIIPILKK